MLRGSLEEFLLSDILRLLSSAKKTGRIDVQHGSDTGTIYFRDGDVQFAESTVTREPLGQKLIRAGLLTERQLTAALDEHAETGQRVGEVLVDHGAIGYQQLEDAMTSQVHDTAFELLRWTEGEFVFEAGDDAVAEVPISVSIDVVLSEVARRVEEFERMLSNIPSVHSVLRVAPAPPEGAHQISITAEEWRFLVMIDGHRSVRDIGATAKVDEFTAMRVLYGLVDAGLVEVLTQEVGADGSAAPVTSPSMAEEAGAPVTDAVADPDSATPSEPTADTEYVAEPVTDVAPGEDTTETGDVVEGNDETFVVDAESLDVSSNDGDVVEAPSAEVKPVDAPGSEEAEPVDSLEYEEAEASNEDAEPVDALGSEEGISFDSREPEPAEVSPDTSAEALFADPDMPEAVASDAPEPGATGDQESAALDDVSEVAFELSEVAAAAFSPDDDSFATVAPAAAESAPIGDGGEDEGDYLGSFLDDEKPDAQSSVAGDPEREPPAPPRRPGRKIDRSMREPVPNLDRAAVVRELASLFSDDDPMRGATTSDEPAAERYEGETPEAPRPKRVEDDEQLSKGLIHRLIDGVKGL